MSSNLHIREATAADVQLISQLAEQIWEPTYGSILSKEQLDYMLDAIYKEEALLKQMEEGQVFLLLFSQQQALGFASFSPEDAAKSIYKLNKIYLHQAAQGKGAGKMLLRAVEDAVRERGAKVLTLNVNRLNPAKSFYEACGFAVTAEEDIPIGSFWMNDFVMKKAL